MSDPGQRHIPECRGAVRPPVGRDQALASRFSRMEISVGERVLGRNGTPWRRRTRRRSHVRCGRACRTRACSQRELLIVVQSRAFDPRRCLCFGAAPVDTGGSTEVVKCASPRTGDHGSSPELGRLVDTCGEREKHSIIWSCIGTQRAGSVPDCLDRSSR